MKQIDIFGDVITTSESAYTKKIVTPVYEPKNKCPFVLELFHPTKSNRLINEIEASGVSDDEKKFLLHAARRHTVFNYSKIADYYAHASKEMQDLMEKSALVIIDFEKAIQHGYVRLSQDVFNQYLEDTKDGK